MLTIKHLTKKFGNKKILDDVSLNVGKGEIAVLLGSSGVGKSTLLRILNSLETFDSGSIELDGKPLNPKTINKKHLVGMVFQHFNLFNHLTVEENITLALTKVLGKTQKEAQKIAHTLLEQYGLGDKANKYASQLSGGQKQRLAIARSIALKPQILCLDEPTSALDPLLTTYIANTITQLAKQEYTILIATHDTDLLDKLNCTIYLMGKGKIVESATSTEFNQNKSKYPKLNAFVSGILE